MTSGRLRGAALLLAALAMPALADGGGDTPAAALARGDPRAARDLLAAAIAARPGAAGLHVLQAETALRLGDGIAAQQELDFAGRLGIAAPDLRVPRAEALVVQARGADAIAELDAGPIRAVDTARAWRVRGQALALETEDDAARLAFDRATLLAPGDARLWIAIGAFRRSRGDTVSAIRAAERALAIDPRVVPALQLRGDLALGQNGPVAGIAWYDRALAIDPRDVASLIARAAAAGETGRTRRLLADSRAALALEPGDPRPFYLQAVLAARSGRFALARTLLDRTAGKLDGQPATLLLDGIVSLATGSTQQAIRALDKLTDAQPDNVRALRLLAYAQRRGGDDVGVIATLRPLAGGAGADSWTLLTLARALERQGDRAGAATYLDRAARMQPGTPAIPPRSEIQPLYDAAHADPASAPARIALIRALVAGDYDAQAAAEAADLVRRNPGIADAQALLGDTLAVRGSFAAAATAYRTASNLAFSEPVALRLIDALRRAGDGPGAQRALALYLQQNPRSVPARRLAADLMMRAGRPAAQARLLEAIRRDTGDRDPVLLADLAWSYARLGRRRAALATAAAAWRLAPASPALAHSYGWLLTQAGQPDRAVPLLAQAAAERPGDAAIRAHLAMAETASGPRIASR